jgi:hypothetical protein
MISIERKILTHATETEPDPQMQAKLRRLMCGDVDFDHLINEACREGVAGLLYKSLMKSSSLQHLDAAQRERLRALYYGTVRCNLKLIHDLKKILSLLNQRRIKVVILQGISLLDQIYNDIGLRSLTDVDLWVMKEHYEGLMGVLSDLGYQRDPLYPSTFRKGSTIIDVNTHLLWAERIKSRKSILPKGQECIYENVQAVAFEGMEAFCLDPYDQVVYLSLHALKHSVSRLLWLVDIKNIFHDWKEDEWRALERRARALGTDKIVSYVVFLLGLLFQEQLPLEARRVLAVKRLSVWERKLLKQRIKKDSLPLWAPLLLLSSGQGLGKRAFFFFENLFPRTEVLRQVFAELAHCAVWRLYWKRFAQLFTALKPT